MTGAKAHTAAMSVTSIYRNHARDWAQSRTNRLVEKPWLDLFLGLVPVGGQVLDIGCGSGIPIARYLTDQGRSVTGVDAAPEMLDMFRANISEPETVLADMRAMALGRTFDGILAWDSLFHLPPSDQRAMFDVLRAHAAPKAALLFNTGTQLGESMGQFAGEPLYHSSLDEAKYRRLLARNGFDVIKYSANESACGGRTIWLAQRRN